MISVRCSALKLSSDMSVSTVSPDGARCCGDRLHIVDIQTVVGIEQHLALIGAPRFSSLAAIRRMRILIPSL